VASKPVVPKRNACLDIDDATALALIDGFDNTKQ
jgi:hypothetical protein